LSHLHASTRGQVNMTGPQMFAWWYKENKFNRVEQIFRTRA